MMSDAERDRLQALADAVVEQTINAEQAQELARWLQASDEARRHYVIYLGLSASLHHYAGRLPAVTPAAIQPTPARPRRFLHSRPAWILTACVLLALTGWVMWRWSDTTATANWPVVEAIVGELEVESKGTRQVIGDRAQLRASDRVRVPANALALLRYPDATVVELRPETAVQLDNDVSPKTLLLEQGTLFAEVQSRHSMVIVTPTARAVLLGTRFLLTATADDTRLDVQRGNAQLASRQDQPPQAVAGGQSAVARSNAAIEVMPSLPGNENLVQNPGFELGEPNARPPHWGGNRLAVVDRTVAHTGNASLRIAGPEKFSYVWQSVALEPDTSYRLSVWIKTEGVTGTDGVRARYAQIGPTTVIWHRSAIKGTNDWVPWHTEFRTPTDYCFGRLDLTFELNAGEVAWFDDVELVKLPPAR